MPRRLKTELRKLEYTAIYVVSGENGNPVKIGYASDPAKRLWDLHNSYVEPLFTRHLVWTPGRPVAQRVCDAATSYLTKHNRRIREDWFDVPLRLAIGAIVVAAQQLRLPLISHDEMLKRCRDAEREKFERLRISDPALLTGVLLKGKNRRQSDESYPPPDRETYPYIDEEFRRSQRGKKKTRHKAGSGRRQATS